MTHDEKVPYMIQWWTEAHESIIKQRISKKGKYQKRKEEEANHKV